MSSKSWTAWRPERLIDAAPSTADEDEALVARALADPCEFAALYQRYVRSIYGYCHQRLGNRDEAEDATSQTFLKALAALPRYRAQSFRAWLFTIARNVIADVHRRRPVASLDGALALEATERSPENEALRTEAEQSVSDLLAHLTPKQRDVVELRLAGLRTSEIAAVLHRRQGAIRATKMRAYERLRDVVTLKGEGL